MAASTACRFCISRLGLARVKPVRSTSFNKLLCLSRNQKIPCRASSQHPPNFYRHNEKVTDNVERTGVETSTAEWKWVERLIPPLEIPTLPKHESYPTPSGWSPPTGASPDTPYHISRTCFHSLPVHRVVQFGDSRQLTVVAKVDGDIWALANELKEYLQTTREDIDMEIPMQVNEYTRKIWFKGVFEDDVKDYIRKKGF